MRGYGVVGRGESGWQSPDLPMSHVSAAQQQAHPSVLMQASTCWDVRGGSGGRSVCNSHVLSPQRAACLEVHGEREEGGDVMVIQRLMEMSCRDSVLV